MSNEERIEMLYKETIYHLRERLRFLNTCFSELSDEHLMLFDANLLETLTREIYLGAAQAKSLDLVRRTVRKK